MPDLRVLTFDNKKVLPEHVDHSLKAQLEDGSEIPGFTIRLNEQLDIHKLFNAFISELGTIVSFDSVEFKDELRDISLENGTSGKHRSVYTITYGQQPLGRLCLTRNTRFTSREIHMFEAMIAGLVVPLHNVMQYQKAMP